MPCKESYNLRARRSSTPVHELYGKKKKKSQNSFHRSLAKRSKKKKVKTPEEYETEWNRRQDSPYPRRHSEIITGTSANEMVLFAETQSSDNIDIEVDLSNLRKKHKSKEMKKRKLETIREDSEESIRKKLKLTVKLAGRVIGRGDYKYVLVEDEEDELDDPDWEESHLDRKKKKSTRTGKDLGHRGVLEETLGDSVPPSTARYLATLRAPYSSAVGSEHISQSELQALSSVASGAASLTTPPRASISRSSSSTSLASDSREDSEPGWEIGSRTPLALQSLSHASSRSNSARNLRSSPSARSSSGRPALRRERSTVHPNAFFVGVPAELAAAVLSSNENSLAAEMEDIPVPVQGTQLHDASNGEEIHVMSEQQDCEEDELILGILSPERQLSPTEEGEESSIFDETCPELDELSSSPEELDDIGMQDGFGNSAAGDDNELANEGLKHCPTRMDFAVHAKGEEVRDEAEERTASEDEEEEDEDEEDEDASRASSSPIERPEDLFDDEVAGEEIRNHEATVCRLRESISLRGGLPEKEETEEDIGFVQGLLERCDIHVHRPGSPLPKEPVIFPVKQEKKDIKLGQNKQRKLKKSKKKLGSVACVKYIHHVWYLNENVMD